MKTSTDQDARRPLQRLVLHPPLIMTVVWLSMWPLVSYLLDGHQAAAVTIGMIIGAWGQWGSAMMQNAGAQQRRDNP